MMDVSNQSMLDEPARSFYALAAGLIMVAVPLVSMGIIKRVGKRDRFRRLNMLKESIDLHISFICSDETSDSVRDDSWTKLQDAYLEHSEECRRQCDKLRRRRRKCGSDEAAQITRLIEEIQARDREMQRRKCRMAA